ncbi:collectrin [Poeciliopsis prolifica]|uniref:collectrin n=1 Tax=Poeciliopsis prolifica TaxID=188132 RepID=UPI0024137628|nr:collectrin [Poeciliopsis prolifica]
MLGRIVFFLCLPSVLAAQLCKPNAAEGFKVRLSIKTALGDKAYEWNRNQRFLFQAALAFAMSHHLDLEFDVSNILVCDETPRVSFWFVVTSPDDPSRLVGKKSVESAVRESRSRINNILLLNDATLEFVGVLPTLASPAKPATPSWLIVFGVVIGMIGAGIVFLIVSMVVQKKRKEKEAGEEEEEDDEEAQMKGTARNEGIYNTSFSEDDRNTQM